MNYITHRYETRDNNQMIVIYAYTPVSYEFATEDKDIKINAINTAGKIREYVAKNFSKYSSNPTVLLIINGVVIGTIGLTSLLAKK